MEPRQKSLNVQPAEYVKLSQAKAQYEADISEHVDWGKFLLFLGLAYLVSRALQPGANAQNLQQGDSANVQNL